MDNVRVTDSVITFLGVEHAVNISNTVGVIDTAADQSVNVNEDVTDAVGIADSAQVIMSGIDYSRTPTDVVSVVDLVTVDSTRGLTDAVAVTDSVSTSSNVDRTRSDTIGITDNIQTTLTTPGDLIYTDPAGILEIVEVAQGKGHEDAIGLTDTVTVTIGRGAALIDPVGVTDTVTRERDLLRTTSNIVGIFDSLVVHFDGPVEVLNPRVTVVNQEQRSEIESHDVRAGMSAAGRAAAVRT
jgi:hypothetical protein